MPRKLTSKQDILGEVTAIETAGEFEVTSEMAKSPLSYEDTVIRSFCLACGYSTELSEIGAQKITEKAKAEIPLDWRGYFFESKKCILCSDDYKEISLKKIQ